jgi:hypothetical protein
VRVQYMNVVHGNLEVGIAVSVRICLHKHVVPLLLVAQFAFLVAKGAIADPIKVLIAGSILGIDAMQVDLVTAMEIADDVVVLARRGVLE